MEFLLSLPGSFHVVLARPGELIAAGDIVGFRRVFTAQRDGVVLTGDHAEVLRRAVDAPVDRNWLAARLASPEPPSVLREAISPFVGVAPVPSGYWVTIAAGERRIHRWWTPPDATQPLAAGGLVLREALTAAVTDRIARARGPVSVQLSGGMDSTVLAFSARAARPLLITTAGRSPIDDDLPWARRAAAMLERSAHRVVPADEAPPFFADLCEPLSGFDEPVPFSVGRARQGYTAGLLAEHGIALHLNGQGGDEVLLAPLAYLRQAFRNAPRTGWRQMCGFAALKNTSKWSMTRAVLSRPRPYAVWLRGTANALRIEQSALLAAVGWEAPPLLPPWATDKAFDMVRAAILAAEPRTAADDPATHAAVVRIRASAYHAALYRDAMQADGVPTAMPYFDRAVVEACLSVLPWERTDPWRPKPLLRAAFEAVMPTGALVRRTKGEYNADIHHGWMVHRRQVTELLDRSRLAELGLVDTARLRDALESFGRAGTPPSWITDLIASEMWLRDLAPPFIQREATHATAAFPIAEASPDGVQRGRGGGPS